MPDKQCVFAVLYSSRTLNDILFICCKTFNSFAILTIFYENDISAFHSENKLVRTSFFVRVEVSDWRLVLAPKYAKF